MADLTCPRCGSTNVIAKLRICQNPGCHHWWD